MYRRNNNQRGITLLITLLLMGVLLGVSTSLLNITLKQFQLSNITADSEMAFQAANAGMECLLRRDFVDNLFLSPEGAARISVECFGVVSEDLEQAEGVVDSGDIQRFEFTWGDPEVCSDVSVYKFYDPLGPVDILVDGVDMRPNADCPPGSICTVVQARGYNVGCENINANSRVVEREYTQVY